MNKIESFNTKDTVHDSGPFLWVTGYLYALRSKSLQTDCTSGLEGQVM